MSIFDVICTHVETTPQDADGKTICTRCGATLQQRLTRQVLDEAFEAVWRDFGMVNGVHRRHSSRCVRLEEGGFVCADDCQMS